MKMLRSVMSVIMFILFSLVPGFSDSGVVVPGERALAFRLGMSKSEAGSAGKGEPKIVSLDRTWDVLKDLLGLDESWNVCFDSAWYYADYAGLFFKDERIVGILIPDIKRIGDGKSDFMRGVNYMIFLYGNQGLVVKKNGQHSFYGYPEKGIALMDDNSDDSIDIILVFKPVK